MKPESKKQKTTIDQSASVKLVTEMSFSELKQFLKANGFKLGKCDTKNKLRQVALVIETKNLLTIMQEPPVAQESFHPEILSDSYLSETTESDVLKLLQSAREQHPTSCIPLKSPLIDKIEGLLVLYRLFTFTCECTRLSELLDFLKPAQCIIPPVNWKRITAEYNSRFSTNNSNTLMPTALALSNMVRDSDSSVGDGSSAAMSSFNAQKTVSEETITQRVIGIPDGFNEWVLEKCDLREKYDDLKQTRNQLAQYIYCYITVIENNQQRSLREVSQVHPVVCLLLSHIQSVCQINEITEKYPSKKLVTLTTHTKYACNGKSVPKIFSGYPDLRVGPPMSLDIDNSELGEDPAARTKTLTLLRRLEFSNRNYEVACRDAKKYSNDEYFARKIADAKQDQKSNRIALQRFYCQRSRCYVEIKTLSMDESNQMDQTALGSDSLHQTTCQMLAKQELVGRDEPVLGLLTDGLTSHLLILLPRKEADTVHTFLKFPRGVSEDLSLLYMICAVAVDVWDLLGFFCPGEYPRPTSSSMPPLTGYPQGKGRGGGGGGFRNDPPPNSSDDNFQGGGGGGDGGTGHSGGGGNNAGSSSSSSSSSSAYHFSGGGAVLALDCCNGDLDSYYLRNEYNADDSFSVLSDDDIIHHRDTYEGEEDFGDDNDDEYSRMDSEEVRRMYDYIESLRPPQYKTWVY